MTIFFHFIEPKKKKMMEIGEIKPEYYKVYEWDFEQDETECIVKVQIPEGVTKEDFSLNRDGQNFTGKIKDEIPFLCGKLCGPVSDFTHIFSENLDSLELHFVKSDPSPWHLPILEPIDQSTPMDPKSTFFVAMILIQDPSQPMGHILLTMAAKMFYPGAIILLESFRLGQGEDISDKIPLLEKIVNEYKVGEAATFLGQLARARKYPVEKAIPMLEKGSQLGDSSSETMLGILLSPYEEPHGNWEDKDKASEWFLKSDAQPRSRYGLGLIKYFNNEKEEGKKLIDEARAEIENLPPIPETDPSKEVKKEEGVKPNLKTVGIIAGSIAGIALLSYAFIKRRK